MITRRRTWGLINDQYLSPVLLPTLIVSVTLLVIALTPQLVPVFGDARHSVVGVELVGTLRARVEDRGSLVSATRLGLAELHLRVVALGTFFVGDLLCARDILRDWQSGETVSLALQSGWVVRWARSCVCLVWPLV